MKKLLVLSTIFASSITFANEQCKHDTILKHSALIGVGLGVVSLAVPVAGPFLSTSLIGGGAAVVTNVSICAYQDQPKVETDPNTYSGDIKEKLKSLAITSNVYSAKIKSEITSLFDKE
jgi:hypothetical protein